MCVCVYVLLADGRGPLVCWCPPRCCAPLRATRPAVLCPPAGYPPCGDVSPCGVVRVRAFSPVTNLWPADMQMHLPSAPARTLPSHAMGARPTVRLRIVGRPASPGVLGHRQPPSRRYAYIHVCK